MVFLTVMESISPENRIIQESRSRSKDFGLDSESPIVRDIMSSSVLHHTRSENFLLLRYAVPVLERIFPRLSPYGYVAILSDQKGNILHSIGDPEFLKKTERVCLKPGANWGEGIRGTNAIGTSLAIDAPVRIHGSNHFMEKNSFLSCAASPIHSPEGKLLGILDITGHYKDEIPHSLSLACLAAESVETRLLLDRSRQEKLEILKELDAISSAETRSIVSLDESRRVVYLNRKAKQILGEGTLGKDWTEVIESPDFPGNPRFHTIYTGRKRVWGFLDKQKPISKETRYTFGDLYCNCPKIQNLIGLAKRAAEHHFPILLLGESGTGKEVYAQSIHNHSSRAGKPFIAVNCSSIPDSLIESELFGYEKGAFTGASKEGGIGKFQAADGGTIFLDEIGDMNPRAQSSLLRVLQEGSVNPVGSYKSHKVDVRVIAATHRNLWKEVQSGKFRKDLYFRLKGIVLYMIPLRERTDIIGLSKDILKKIGSEDRVFSKESLKKILNYTWPGNIRELQSVLQQAVFLSSDKKEIEAESLVWEEDSQEIPSIYALESDGPEDIESTSSKSWEKKAILEALEKENYIISKAAKNLGMGRNTLYRKLRKYSIELPKFGLKDV